LIGEKQLAIKPETVEGNDKPKGEVIINVVKQED
tara:strand:- start:31 stop:132 length:102 start_codon:yes stop_codon:yes gene_type:complete